MRSTYPTTNGRRRGPDDGLKVDYSVAPVEPPRFVPSIVLSDEEERQFSDAGFRCRWPIHVTGRRGARGTNVVEIDGRKLRLRDKPFRLFVRLAVALHETADGWVSAGSMKHGGGLADEGFYTSDGGEKAWKQLRDPLRPQFNSLIERHGGRARLSTHRHYVTWDARCLASADLDVRSLFERLPKPEEA